MSNKTVVKIPQLPLYLKGLRKNRKWWKTPKFLFIWWHRQNRKWWKVLVFPGNCWFPTNQDVTKISQLPFYLKSVPNKRKWWIISPIAVIWWVSNRTGNRDNPTPSFIFDVSRAKKKVMENLPTSCWLDGCLTEKEVIKNLSISWNLLGVQQMRKWYKCPNFHSFLKA